MTGMDAHAPALGGEERSDVTVRVPGDEELLTRTRPHPSVILPIEGAPPIFRRGRSQMSFFGWARVVCLS